MAIKEEYKWKHKHMNSRVGRKRMVGEEGGRKRGRENEGRTKWIQTNIKIEGRIQQVTNLHGNTAITT